MPLSSYSFTCVAPEEADQALQLQQINMLACDETVGKKRGPYQLQSKRRSSCTNIMHVPRWFFAFPIEANMLSFVLGQIVQGKPFLPCSRRGAAASAIRRCVRSSSSSAPFSRHRLLGGNEVAAVSATSRLTITSRRKASRYALQ